jgi:hypothetical protein
MKIRYNPAELKGSKKQIRYYLLLGMVFIIFDLLFDSNFKFSPELVLNSTGAYFVFMSLFFIIYYQIISKKGYAVLKKNLLSKTGLFQKKINLMEVNNVRRFAGDYIFKKDKKELFILDTQRCDPNDINLLMREIDKRGISWT